MARRILIMGLPGAGKTTLAAAVVEKLKSLNKSVDWFNADEIRKQYNDWDFSDEGRIRQSHRMRSLADASLADFALVDFVAPLEEMRLAFDASYTVWVDTIAAGRFEDTNRVFVEPKVYNLRVTTQDAESWSNAVVAGIINPTSWTVVLEEDAATGELMLPLPEELLAAAGLKEGDDLVWEIVDASQVVLKKKKPVDSESSSV